MRKKTEKFAEQVANAAGNNLESLIAYGSAATGELYRDSDYNMLIILKDTSAESLLALSGPCRKWEAAGNPVPLIFGHDRILRSDDVFPMEFFDIKESHIVLRGKDVFKRMKIRTGNLRFELEKEIKNFVLNLRRSYISTGGEHRKVKRLMISSVSTLTVFLKSLIRLYGKKAPVLKRHIIDDIPDVIKCDKKVFYKILTLKEGSDNITKSETNTIFDEYMKEILKIADSVDRFRRRG